MAPERRRPASAITLTGRHLVGLLRFYSNFDLPGVVPVPRGLEAVRTLDEQAVAELADAVVVASDVMTRGAPRVVVTGPLRRAVVARYEAGESAASIARVQDIAKSTVQSILKQAGVAVRHPRLTAEQCVEICELYEAGVAQVDIAKKFDKDPGNIWHVLNRAGLVGRRVR